MNKTCQSKLENSQHILLLFYRELLCSAQTPKKVCHFADNHYPIFQQVLLGWWFLYRSNIASKQWIFIAFYFPGKCWRCSAMFNLWAQITDWVDNISSSFYISPFFLPSPFFLWIILSTYLHKCHVYQFRERSVPYFCAYPGACTLPWETQNENKLCQTISPSKLIKMHGVLVRVFFSLKSQKKQCVQANSHSILNADHTLTRIHSMPNTNLSTIIGTHLTPQKISYCPK